MNGNFGEVLAMMQLIKTVNEIENQIESGSILITWETDLNKMDFSRLRSGKLIKPSDNIKVEYMYISDLMKQISATSLFSDDSTEYLISMNLINLVKSGTKIIPPHFQRQFSFIDGVRYMTYHAENKRDVMFVDGVHRILLSRMIGLKKIPVVVQEKHEYTFTYNKWEMQCEGEKGNQSLIISSKDGTQKFCFNEKECDNIHAGMKYVFISC